MSSIDRLLDIMARLRDPQNGCPWDIEQNFASIAPYTIEEAYEVEDAIVRNDTDGLRDELGDLLLQVVFHAQMAREAGLFDFTEVVKSICDKMIRRHPHVFGDERVADSESQTRAWEAHKERERASGNGSSDSSVLADVPHALPALLRSEKLGKRAARAGFDWPDVAGVRAKVEEELDEIDEARAIGPAAVEQEVGDLLFACAQLGRFLGVNPETALRGANRRFEGRFRSIENALDAQGRELKDASMDELEGLWNDAKQQERSAE